MDRIVLLGTGRRITGNVRLVEIAAVGYFLVTTIRRVSIDREFLAEAAGEFGNLRTAGWRKRLG